MAKTLQFIHVGKCAGSTLAKLLPYSPVISKKYSHFYESHVNGVEIDSNCDYLICLRNPISRAISAFEWRKKLVLIEANPSQVNRFSGEMEILRRYSSLSELSKRLYNSEGFLVQNVARDFRLIHHLRESISFYLSPLLAILSRKNVLGVICQETFASDCECVLGVGPESLFERGNPSKTEEYLDFVGNSQSYENLRKFLVDDYVCLARLWASGILSDEKYKTLLSFSSC